MRRHIPNALSALRVLLAVLLVLCRPFGAAFFALYLACGASDVLDGYLARRWQVQSEAGQKIDSAADAAFAAAILWTVLSSIAIPLWLVIWIIVIALVRLLSAAVCRVKFGAFAFLHTYGNKLTGALLFVFPMAYPTLGLTAPALIAGVSASLSAIEELAIAALTTELDRDAKSIIHACKKTGKGL